jgi:hypothetical protein
MNSVWHHLPVSNWITTQFIRHDLPGLASMRPQQSPEEPLCSRPIPASLQKYINDLTILINCPSQRLPLAIDLDENLVDVKGVALALMLLFQAPGLFGSKVDAPEPDGLVANDDATFSQEIFDIPVAEVEAITEPDRVTDDCRRKPVTSVSIHGPILAISAS